MTQRVVLVTGAGQGIGLAVAQAFLAVGDKVIGTDRNPEAAALLATHGIEFFCQDVADEAQWELLANQLAEQHGVIDVLVNNAGTDGGYDSPRDPVGTPLEVWERVFAVNARGCFLGCKYAIPLMARAGRGAIVNVSSVAACVPTPFLTAYGAAKAAVDHLTRTIALYCAEQGTGIRCNSVHPGQARTPLLDTLFGCLASEAGVDRESFDQQFLAGIPLGEFQAPDDIADAVFFLASSKARMITGQALAIDGGFLLRR